ncbi:electron transport complex subunit RsxG [Neptunomonas japonica]|uniref:Ion-translocating oxidoreductase complex subunit G n=1 Tax=Neptunomonas japonica JAMM 1380 TaxID=1441457 RepID=A0A7R6SV33_9GAMM|nr:electron transport complex subunit RsxG [Neptunomonas japonica]BBB28981.1 electron transport complex protein RnfG [Neptunomonas japonica JAMM 1380]
MELLISLRKNTLGISIFAIVTAGLIAITQVSTKDQILENERAQQAKALYEIISRDSIDNDLLQDVINIEAPELGYPLAKIYQAKRENLVKAVIIPVISPDGYSGDITLIVGINADNSVAGVRVLSHKETPGLGDKIDLRKSNWIMGFDEKSMTSSNDSSWAVKKDGGQFDQFTGATITPRAVVNAVGQALVFFKQNRDLLLSPKPIKEAS